MKCMLLQLFSLFAINLKSLANTSKNTNCATTPFVCKGCESASLPTNQNPASRCQT